jgi:Ca2+-binding RTX toxin-like protein
LLSANHLPKLVAPLPDRTIAVGAGFAFSFAASSFADADGDTLAFAVQMPDGSALPSWVAFDPATRTFSGLAPSSATMISVSVAASDPGGMTGFDTFDLTVGSTGGARALYGTPGNDSVSTGSSTNDTVYAGAGNDTVYGYAGNNALYGGDGNDYLGGGQGTDTLFGGAGNDSLSGDQGADNLIGGTGNDTFYVDNPADVVVELPGEGDDAVTAYVDYALSDNIERLTLVSGATRGTGNASNNFIVAAFNVTAALVLDGGAGADTLYGALGNDTYTVDNAGDVVFEFDSFETGGVTYLNTGIDTVNSWVSYALPNNVERLALLGAGNLAGTGNSLANAITGNGGNNSLSGAGGNDTLTGGAGDDTLDGGFGSDTYSFGRGDAADVIASLDATGGKTDTLQLGAAIASSDIVVTRQTNDLLVSIRGTSDSVRVRNHFLGNGNQIDQIRFADGTSWNGQAIAGQLSAQSPATAMSALLAAQFDAGGGYRARGLLVDEVGGGLGSDFVSTVAFDQYSAGISGADGAPDGLLAGPSPDPFAARAQRLVDAMAIFAASTDAPLLGAVHQATTMPVTLPQHAF